VKSATCLDAKSTAKSVIILGADTGTVKSAVCQMQNKSIAKTAICLGAKSRVKSAVFSDQK
jgi:hypothetical protein